MDSLTLIALIIIDSICILAGSYSGYKFYRAYMDQKDLLKYSGYLVNAFLMIIVIPLLITLVLIKIEDIKYPSVAVSVKVKDFRGTYGHMSMDTLNIDSTGTKKGAIDIFNKDEDQKNLVINIACISGSCKRKIIQPKFYEIKVKPDIIYELPIILNIYEDMQNSEHKFNISLQDENGSIYDFALFEIDVK